MELKERESEREREEEKRQLHSDPGIQESGRKQKREGNRDENERQR
jgi:hypothetical protein